MNRLERLRELAAPEGGPVETNAGNASTDTSWSASQLPAAIERAARDLDLAAGWLFAVGPAGAERSEPELLAAYPSTEQPVLVEAGRWLATQLPPHGPAVADLPALPRSDARDWLLELGARSAAVAPVVVGGQAAAALLVAGRGEAAMLPVDRLGRAADWVALALESARRERELRERLDRAERRASDAERRDYEARAAAAESARVREELRRRDRELSALVDVARALNREDGLDLALSRAVDHVVEVMGVDAAMIRLVQGEELVLAAHRGLSAEFVGQVKRLPIARSTSGTVVRLGRPQVIDDSVRDERVVHPLAAREGIVSLALVPMLANGRVVGVLNALSRHPRRFGEHDILLLSTIAAQIGSALENARLRAAEREASAAVEELSQLKNDLVLTVSHELRTPMAIVKASLDALWRHWERVDERRRRAYVAVGRQGASRLKRQLENLLLVSRIETHAFAAQLEPVEVAPLVRGIVDEVLAERPKRRIELSGLDSLPAVLADRVALGEIMANLLDNAVRYSPPDLPIEVRGWVVDEEVRVSVIDQGTGIAPADLDRLFQRFGRIESDRRSQAGTGLGLYICRRLVEGMGGRIRVESAPGHGSTFTIVLNPAPAALVSVGRQRPISLIRDPDGPVGARGQAALSPRPGSRADESAVERSY